LTTYGIDDINRVLEKMRGSEAIWIFLPAKVTSVQETPSISRSAARWQDRRRRRRRRSHQPPD
jgi:hypothetical protein